MVLFCRIDGTIGIALGYIGKCDQVLHRYLSRDVCPCLDFHDYTDSCWDGQEKSSLFFLQVCSGHRKNPQNCNELRSEEEALRHCGRQAMGAQEKGGPNRPWKVAHVLEPVERPAGGVILKIFLYRTKILEKR